MVGQLLQIVGALMLLGAFAGAQLRLLRPDAFPYLILNLLGSALLAVLAYIEQQWGFLLLEGVWALVSLWSVLRHLRGEAQTAR
jgi:hypothetical protein